MTPTGEHLTDEYENNVNRFKKIPAIVDNDFKLAESIAIYRYLASEHKIADNWYPKDNKKRARVDEYLEWQHVNFLTISNYSMLATLTNFTKRFF